MSKKPARKGIGAASALKAPAATADTKAAAPVNTAAASRRKVTFEIPGDQHKAIRDMAYELNTTMRAVMLAAIEEASTGNITDVIKERTANGRLEVKRGPKPGTKN